MESATTATTSDARLSGREQDTSRAGGLVARSGGVATTGEALRVRDKGMSEAGGSVLSGGGGGGDSTRKVEGRTISSATDVYAAVTGALAQALVHCERFEVCEDESRVKTKRVGVRWSRSTVTPPLTFIQRNRRF